MSPEEEETDCLNGGIINDDVDEWMMPRSQFNSQITVSLNHSILLSLEPNFLL
jgi:hypothetical protein